MRKLSKITTGSVSLFFAGAVATECVADPGGSHDAPPRAALTMTMATSTVTANTVMTTFASNTITDEDVPVVPPRGPSLIWR
jgi:hypothetical protein